MLWDADSLWHSSCMSWCFFVLVTATSIRQSSTNEVAGSMYPCLFLPFGSAHLNSQQSMFVIGALSWVKLTAHYGKTPTADWKLNWLEIASIKYPQPSFSVGASTLGGVAVGAGWLFGYSLGRVSSVRSSWRLKGRPKKMWGLKVWQTRCLAAL